MPSHMPIRKFGGTGQPVPVLGIGSEQLVDEHGCAEAESELIINTALDKGVYYFDTAPAYSNGLSESRLGRVAKYRRNEMWIATKTAEVSEASATRQLHQSLERLGTDYVDEWRLHNIWDYRRLDNMTADDGALRAAIRAKEEGVVRYISVSSHTDPEILIEAIKRFPFDSALFPVSVLDDFVLSFSAEFLPLAKVAGIATIGMKVLCRGLLAPFAERAIHYALTHPLDSVIVGINSLDQLIQNISIAKSFMPMSDSERLQFMKEMVDLVEPKNLRWKASSWGKPEFWVPRNRNRQ